MSKKPTPLLQPRALATINGLRLAKSVHSASNGACVAVAQLNNGTIIVGDTKRPWQKVLRFTPAEWEAFTAGVKDGEFDLRTVHQTNAHSLRFAALQRAWSWLRRPTHARVS